MKPSKRSKKDYKKCELTFPTKWVNGICLDEVLKSASKKPHDSKTKEIVFLFPQGCKVLIDAAVQILSLANQMIVNQKKVLMRFEDNDAKGYLDRMGFFQELHKRVRVEPERPDGSALKALRGKSSRVLEINAIKPRQRNKNLPSSLAELLANVEADKVDKRKLRDSAFTVFGELIDNIFQHSSSRLNGYAAFQVYKKNGKNNSAMVVVSDSGKGLLKTLRPAISRRREYRKYKDFSDTSLIVEMFKTGISRKGMERGCGLKACADEAIKFNADLRVRLNECAVYLKPSGSQYVPNMAYKFENLPMVKGTHIAFTFHLD